MQKLLVEEPGKKEPHQIARDKGNRALGGQVLAIQMVDPAGLAVGFHEPVGQLVHGRLHSGNYQGNPRVTQAARWKTEVRDVEESAGPELFIRSSFSSLPSVSPFFLFRFKMELQDWIAVSTRRRILLLLLVVIGLATAVYVSRPREPVYQGVPLSGWLKQLEHPQDWSQRERAEEAVWQIGTNAVPYLLEVLHQSDTPFKVRSISWLEKRTHMDLDRFLATDRQTAAAAAIQVLGPRFRPWLPELAAMAANNDPNVSGLPLWLLGLTRCKEAIPILTSAMTNGPANAPAVAAYSAGALGHYGRPAIPALIWMLDRTNIHMRLLAARALQNIGLEPQIAVPALTGKLADTDPLVLTYVAGALAAFGTDAASSQSALSNTLQSPNLRLRRIATNVLVRVKCEMRDGAIIRGPQDEKRLALVFAAHEYAEGAETILNELVRHHAKASFFLTGTFLENTNFVRLLERMRHDEYLLGPHSDRHLLYCSWDNPPKTLVQWHEFRQDLLRNSTRLDPSLTLYPGDVEWPSSASSRYFLPAYEHYNRDIADWTRETGRILINFTPGTRSTADYTGEADKNFASSQTILDSIISKEQQDPHGLNGFLLLMHLGSGPGRMDKFHSRLGELLDYLSGKGYQMVRVDELLGP